MSRQSRLERELAARCQDPGLPAEDRDLLRRASVALTLSRVALGQSRVWWDSRDLYKEPWKHGDDCGCQACIARESAARALEILERP